MFLPQVCFISLPDDILIKILTLLSASEIQECGLLCKRLYSLSLTRSIWIEIYDHGNHGFMAFLASNADPRSMNPAVFQRLLVSAELLEKKWAGLVPRERPKLEWVATFSPQNASNILGVMGPFYVSIHREWGPTAFLRWYRISAGEGPNGSEAEPPAYEHLLPASHNSRPQNFIDSYDTRLTQDSMHIVRALKDDETKTRLDVVKYSLVDGELLATQETSVVLPVKLLKGKVKWLDDDHVIIAEYNDHNTYSPFFNPNSVGKILLLEWKTSTITFVPPHQCYTRTESRRTLSRDLAYNPELDFFLTRSYIIQLSGKAEYEVLQRPKATDQQQRAEVSVLQAKKIQVSGVFPSIWEEVWQIYEHSPRILTVVGLSGGTRSTIVVVRLTMHESDAITPPTSIEIIHLRELAYPLHVTAHLIYASHPFSRSLLVLIVCSTFGPHSHFHSAPEIFLVRISIDPEFSDWPAQHIEVVKVPKPDSQQFRLLHGIIAGYFSCYWVDQSRARAGLCLGDADDFLWEMFERTVYMEFDEFSATLHSEVMRHYQTSQPELTRFTMYTGICLLSLPDDVLIGVLSLLPASEIQNCGLVCRHLYELSLLRSVWTAVYDTGNHGFMALLPSGANPRAMSTKDFQRLLVAAELSERKWAGLVPEKAPQLDWVGSFNPRHDDPRGIMQVMGPFYVCLRAASERSAIINWYPRPGVRLSYRLPTHSWYPGRDLQPSYREESDTEPVYQYELSCAGESRPLDFRSSYSVHFFHDSMCIARARSHGESQTKLEFTICSLIDGERVHTALETSVRLPIKLLAGEIRWLDDNHVIITEYNGENTYLPFFDPDAAGNILLLEWKTGTITYVPPHVSSSSYFPSIGSAAKPGIL
ncbi:hypothetical protein NP233_g4625 [Leucocoprinus birnbaumii]|uniref:F-box domain-containing protein n=1 Tax=Leucocoprinus birnbaumii TaxID=56174 RepID=A0AAD5YSM9_9AGAR|nr:hypothetical protein NP233_g4625 [Leucocoprinus birnbaumii]